MAADPPTATATAGEQRRGSDPDPDDARGAQLLFERDFEAPRDLVFRACTEPRWLVRWLGTPDRPLTVERYELRDGGRWRYVVEDGFGQRHGFHGVFHGVPGPDLIVQTFEYDGRPGRVRVDTAALAEHGGITSLRVVAGFPSLADRDDLLAGGAEREIRASYDRLAALLSKLRTVTRMSEVMPVARRRLSPVRDESA